MAAYSGPVLLPWLAAQSFLTLTAVLLVGRSPARRAWAGLLVGAALALPLCAPPRLGLRLLLTSFATLALIKVSQIGASPEGWPPLRRLWHLAEPFDIRKVVKVRPGWDGVLALNVAIHAGLLVGGILCLRALPPGTSDFIRGFVALTLPYSGFEGPMNALRLVHRLLGLRTPDIQRTPIAARSLAEFWGLRWNRSVSEWLAFVAFRPLARRGHPDAGIQASFVLSALLHGYLAWVVLDLHAAWMWTAFFLLHGFGVFLEGRLGVAGWPPVPARAWTLGYLLATSPCSCSPGYGPCG